MIQPEIEFVPLHEGLPRGSERWLDVLVRIRTPELPKPRPLPAMNLSIVLDRSGSMAGEKLEYAKAAARQAVALLGPADRLNLISFGDEVETLASGAGAEDHEVLRRAIDGLTADGSTALHAGWVRGVTLLHGRGARGSLSRVLLVSDGQANRGEQRKVVIAHQVQQACAEGISTSALGVGRDFNEDLLEAIARAGDGEYHFVESPAQLPKIFAEELRSLTRTFGRQVSLGLRPAAGVRIADVLNDLEHTKTRRLRLPNLVHGRAIEVLVRLELSASEGDFRELFQARVAWDPIEGIEREKTYARFALPVLAEETFRQLTANPAVREQALLLEAARTKTWAMDALDQGELEKARRLLESALAQVSQEPGSKELSIEASQLRLLLETLAEDRVITRKRSKAQSYERQNSRLGSPPKH